MSSSSLSSSSSSSSSILTVMDSWIRINDLHRSFVKFIAPLVTTSPTEFISTIHLSLCLCFSSLQILHVVHCVGFVLLAFSLQVQGVHVITNYHVLIEQW